MSRARLVITAVVVEGRGVREVARAYGVSPGWVSRLVARYRAEGEAAFQARSRAPRSSPRAISAEVVGRIVELRQALLGAGDDAGPVTISWHLAQEGVSVSPATISRQLHKAGLVVPQPQKRPRSSWVRFEAEQPNETWQADFTHYRLADGTEVEILSWLDDHARFALGVSAHRRIAGPIVVAEFRKATAAHGVPASTLTDNGLVFTTRLAGGKGGRNGFESELDRLRVRQKNSRPNHPTTCGKVERFQQTLKRWLAAQTQPASLGALQELLEVFVLHYNQDRPHRSLANGSTPATAYAARPKASPEQNSLSHYRVRHDIIDKTGVITLRVGGRLHHIGLGRDFAGWRVLVLVQDLNVRVVAEETGEPIRELRIDTTRDYQPTGTPPGPPKGRKRS
jgi:transposase InsO family protein